MFKYKISVTHIKKNNNDVLTLPSKEKFGSNLQEYIFIVCTNVYAIFDRLSRLKLLRSCFGGQNSTGNYYFLLLMYKIYIH